MFSGENQSLEFSFYQSKYFDSDLNQRSGGDIAPNELYTDSFQNLGTIKVARTSQPITYYYRKIFFKNDTEYNLTGIKAYIDNETTFLSIAKEKNYRDFSTSATGLPNGYISQDFSAPHDYDNGINIGNMSSGAYTGLWLKIGTTDDSIIEEDELIKTYKSKIYFEGFIE